MTSRDVLAGFVAAFTVILIALFVHTASASSAQLERARWQTAQASYYTLYGNRTACGHTASSRAWFVASLKPDTAKCGMRITICHRGRCVHTRVQDRGAWRTDNRRWDLQPRVKKALRCSDVCTVRWSKGWNR